MSSDLIVLLVALGSSHCHHDLFQLAQARFQAWCVEFLLAI